MPKKPRTDKPQASPQSVAVAMPPDVQAAVIEMAKNLSRQADASRAHDRWSARNGIAVGVAGLLIQKDTASEFSDEPDYARVARTAMGYAEALMAEFVKDEPSPS